jgi:hypothetical protein
MRGPSINVFGLFLLILLAMGVALVILVVRRRRGRRITQPICGQCSYSVRGLPGFICPECGGDLREVGIITPQMKPVRGPLIPLLGWTIIVIVVGFGSTVLIGENLSHRSFRRETWTLVSPKSQAYREIAVQAEGPDVAGQPRFDEVVVTVSPHKGNVIVLKVFPEELDYMYRTAEGWYRSEDPLETDAFLKFMSTADNIDVENPDVRKEANEVVQFVQRAAVGIMSTYQFQQFRGHSRTGRIGSMPRSIWLVPGFLAFWVIVWLVGSWRIMRKPATLQVEHRV